MKKVRTRNDFIFMITMIILFSAVGSMLTGCAALDMVKSKGAELSDEMIETSIWNICQAATVGSVRRKFKTPEDIRIYNEMCKTMDNSVLVP